jgi:hypothetical protein
MVSHRSVWQRRRLKDHQKQRGTDHQQQGDHEWPHESLLCEDHLNYQPPSFIVGPRPSTEYRELFTLATSRWNSALADFQLLPRAANYVRRMAARRCCLRLVSSSALAGAARFAWLRMCCQIRVLDCWPDLF